MELTPDTFEDVIGAYALDALDDDERDAVEAYVDAHPEARAEVERLREAAAALGAAGALQPPLGLHDRLMRAASERVAPVQAIEALDAETERFVALLETVDEADANTTTFNGLAVQELVSHVEAVDRAFVRESTDPRFGFIGANEVAAVTEEELPQFAGETFAATVTRFRRTRSSLAALADRPEDERFAGYRRDDTLMVRVFETWTHYNDICHALGREAAPPAPAVMRAMAELAVRSLPVAMAVRGTAQPDRTVRLVLTGPGGGDWTLACGPGEPSGPADVEITAPVVDWCLRFADRLEPDEIAMQVDGDADLAGELVSAANAFAGL